MTEITNISIVGNEIFIYRRFIVHRYKNSWKRAALIRCTIMLRYLYHSVVKWDIEQFRIDGNLPEKYW